MPPYVWWVRLIIILARRPFPLMFGVYLTGLFEDPNFFVGMIGKLVWGAVDLARPI